MQKHFNFVKNSNYQDFRLKINVSLENIKTCGLEFLNSFHLAFSKERLKKGQHGKRERDTEINLLNKEGCERTNLQMS